MIEKKRNYNYDLVRFIAVLLIVLCHALETVYFGKNNISIQSKLFYIAFHTISRLGVPLFLFLTGALLLNKKFNDEEDIKHFYKHNMLNLIIVCEIWYIIYYLLDIIVFKKSYHFKDFIPILFFLKQYPLSHAWYIPMIIGVYATIPFVEINIKKYPKIIKSIMFANIIYVFVIPMVNKILMAFEIKYSIPMDFSMPFAGGVYGIYIMLGYFLTKTFNEQKYKNKCTNVILIITMLISFIITVLIRNKLNCDSWYNMFTILLCSSCLFILLLKVKLILKLNKIMEKLSIYSFGVYLTHIEIISLMNKYGLKDVLNCKMPIKCIIYFIITIVISYIITTLLSKNKYTRKYLLFIK